MSTDQKSFGRREIRAGVALLKAIHRTAPERKADTVRHLKSLSDAKLINFATDLHRQFYVDRSVLIPHDTQHRLQSAKSELESRGYRQVNTIQFIYDERADARSK